MTPESDIIPFLDQFVETRSWATFLVLADFFEEANDPIARDWALWVWRDQKHPIEYEEKNWAKDMTDDFYGWFPAPSSGQIAEPYRKECSHVGQPMIPLLVERHNKVWLYGSTITNCYLALLDCYRQGISRGYSPSQITKTERQRHDNGSLLLSEYRDGR